VQPDLADRLIEISRRLDQGPGKGDSSDGESFSFSTHKEGQQYRQLTAEWESILEHIRSIPDFADFLRPSSSTRLMKAAQGGPVIVLNVAMKCCDALALVPGLDEVVHIPLPNITSKRVTELADQLKKALYSNGVRSRGERAIRDLEDEMDGERCKVILAELWKSLVKPILDSLAFSVRFI
jgi:hypothetical protein